MAFMTFVDGAVLTAAQVMTYLMKQVNIVCTSGTRPASPTAGMVIYETDTDRWMYYTGSAWQIIPTIVSAYKSANESVTSSTVMQNDDHLSIPVKANAVYSGRIVLFVAGDDNADIKTQITVPANCNCSFGQVSKVSTSDTGVGTSGDLEIRAFAEETGTSLNAQFHGLADTNLEMVIIEVTIATGPTAGTATLQWAQNIASATPTTVRKGSTWVSIRTA